MILGRSGPSTGPTPASSSLTSPPSEEHRRSERVWQAERMGDVKRRWRDYKTPAGARPVKKFLMNLPDDHRAAVLDGMREVRDKGEREGGARHLRKRVWEVRVDQGELTYRVLFASVGGKGAHPAFPRRLREEDSEDAANRHRPSRGASQGLGGAR